MMFHGTVNYATLTGRRRQMKIAVEADNLQEARRRIMVQFNDRTKYLASKVDLRVVAASEVDA